MDVYERLKDMNSFLEETDKRIFEIMRNSESTAYENIEKDLRIASSQLRSLIRSNHPNNTANEMSDQFRFQRANESLENCITLINNSSKILGNTYVADSDLVYALNIEKILLNNTSSSKIDEKCLILSYRLNELANYVLETNNINLLD